MVKFRDRLRKTWEVARARLGESQKRMKTLYDRKSRSRVFKPGDKVLVLFPIQTNPLQARFHGSCEIERKGGCVDYVVKMPDRRKASQLCHVKMLEGVGGA